MKEKGKRQTHKQKHTHTKANPQKLTWDLQVPTDLELNHLDH